MNLWQLRRVQTNENLSEPQPLPEVWNGIFGLYGIRDKIGDLSWTLDPELQGVGWFETDIPGIVASVIEKDKAESICSTAKILLKDSDWSMLPDVPMSKGDKIKWEEYRRALREIKLQTGFPDNVIWPEKP
jgi:hypothetical protein